MLIIVGDQIDLKIAVVLVNIIKPKLQKIVFKSVASELAFEWIGLGDGDFLVDEPYMILLTKCIATPKTCFKVS
jgi:hypothetical protein